MVVKVKDSGISFTRMVAMLMIVTCHIFQKYNIGLAWWLNVGVQIFLFMSGWLYGTKQINNPARFIMKNSFKILKYYWIYLLIMLPIYYYG